MTTSSRIRNETATVATTPLNLAVFGAGPGGCTAAFLANDLGMKVTLIDQEKNPGGVCLSDLALENFSGVNSVPVEPGVLPRVLRLVNQEEANS